VDDIILIVLLRLSHKVICDRYTTLNTCDVI